MRPRHECKGYGQNYASTNSNECREEAIISIKCRAESLDGKDDSKQGRPVQRTHQPALPMNWGPHNEQA